MNYQSNKFDGKHYGESNLLLIISIICVILSIVISCCIYFGWKLHMDSERKKFLAQQRANLKIKQQTFIVRLEKNLFNSTNKPEYAVEKAYLQYKEFFSNQQNLTGISFRDVFSRYFPMNLPPASKSEEEIRKYIQTDLIPKKFPNNIGKYKFMKLQEAEKLYPLAEVGDKVTVRSLKEDNYTGIYNGFGSKNASVQIDSKFFALYDLTRESRALFQPVLNELVREEYVRRECELYNVKIERYTASVLSRKMRSKGYFQRVDFFSPSEYLNHLESGTPFKRSKSQTHQVALPKAKETKLRKLSPTGNKYFTQPLYYNRGPKIKPVRTVR